MGASLLLGSIILSNLDYAIFGFLYPDINIRMYFYIAMDLVLALLFINIFTNREWLLTNRWAGAVAIIHILMISVNFAGRLKPDFGKSADHALTLNILLISAFIACLIGFLPKSPDEVSSVLKLKYRYLKNDLLKRWLSRAEVKLPSSEKEDDLVNAFIGQKIKQLRRNADMSQEDLGKILGVSQTQINRIEVGKKRVSAAQLFAFSKLFKILRRWGHRWNHKRVHRIYCRLNLNKRRRGKKRLPNRSPIA